MAHKLMVVSGFLGAGKTTAIASIGKMLIAQGKKVGVVTNDQGDNLVDTNFLEHEGMSVFEISEGCFCCSFDAFTKKLQSLAENEMPDIILAEPIGSCINLVATIFKPIMNNYTKQFTLAPLSVVTDPKRVKRMMNDNGNFRNEINYIFDQQLQEADIILLNKTDKLPQNEIDELTNYLRVKYSPAQVLTISAQTGMGIDVWYDAISNKVAVDKPSLLVDYNVYKRAENALAWHSTFVTLENANKIDYNVVINDLMSGIKEKIALENAEVAHLKIYAVSSYDFAKAGLTSTDGEVVFNKKLEQDTAKINLIINARVEISSDKLSDITKSVLDDIYKKHNLTAIGEKSESYSPDYDMPTCRF